MPPKKNSLSDRFETIRQQKQKAVTAGRNVRQAAAVASAKSSRQNKFNANRGLAQTAKPAARGARNGGIKGRDSQGLKAIAGKKNGKMSTSGRGRMKKNAGRGVNVPTLRGGRAPRGKGGRGASGGRGKQGDKKPKPASADALDMQLDEYWHTAGKGPDPKLAQLDRQMDDYWSTKAPTNEDSSRMQDAS